jgi:agmatine deiminase
MLMFSLLNRRDNGLKSNATTAAHLIFSVEEEEGIAKYIMPPEEAPHEGTWLQWPHNYGYDRKHIQRYEATFIHMTRVLSQGENVHIIAYNREEKRRIKTILKNIADVDMDRISFLIGKTDDVWIRDNGPIFVRDVEEPQQLFVQNWIFSGWGQKAEYNLCNQIPKLVGTHLTLPVVDVGMVNEGGSIELDGRGTLMAKKSSILNNNRNPGWTLEDAEAYFRYYLGVTNFIWLDGGKGQDITDDHIDGTARFVHNGSTIVTFYPYDSSSRKEYNILKNATDVDGKNYSIVHLPLTSRKLRRLRDWGTYINFYVANEVVLVPKYGDKNDRSAQEIIQKLYPERRVVGVDVLELAWDGGMIHCVTQQQPM